MKTLKQTLLLILGLLASNIAFGQVEMADSFRADGKIYVVVAIILIILLGVFVYLFLLDKKIRKLEDQFNEKHPN
jgi:cytochrome c biogenesis protein CcdA